MPALVCDLLPNKWHYQFTRTGSPIPIPRLSAALPSTTATSSRPLDPLNATMLPGDRW
jgi:hypothetical protein